jgi:glucuronokinase
MIITTHAFARAGLAGNPSDAYGGKTLSFIIRDFRTTVQLWESPNFQIVPSHGDLTQFDTVDSFLADLKLHGYYGGMRLIKAAIKRFHDYCHQQGHELGKGSFTIQFHTTIPQLVGLAGSSAIVVATLRALMRYYDVHIPRHLLPSLALSVEADELGLNAGPQDRVMQVYEGIALMNFDKRLMSERGYGQYDELRPPAMPPLYVAYDPDRAQLSDVQNRNLRALFNSGDKAVVGAMEQFGVLADRAAAALMAGDWHELHRITDDNFDLRRSIVSIPPENLRMVEVARSTGASAKFAGSGGAITGLFHSARQYQELVDAMASIRCNVFRPLIFDDAAAHIAPAVKA